MLQVGLVNPFLVPIVLVEILDDICKVISHVGEALWVTELS